MVRKTVQDPVCGMRFKPDQAAMVVEWEGRTFHFCCEACLRSFTADPRRHVRREQEVER